MKVYFALFCLLLTSLSAQAQGTISFKNGSTTPIVIYNYTNRTVAPTGSITIGLYGREQGASSNALVLLSTTAIDLVPGRFNGGIVTNTFVPEGGQGTFQVRAWAGAFSSYEAAYNAALTDGGAMIGTSDIWTQDTGNPSSIPPESPTLMVLGPGGFNGLNVYGALSPLPDPSAPEPSTVILGMVGLGLLGYRCRR